MKELTTETARMIKATAAHYHWSCLDFGIGKKRYISEPYFYNSLTRTGKDIQNHIDRFVHQRYIRLQMCYKNCRKKR